MELIAGGVLVIIGFVLGRVHRPAKKPPKPPPEVCQCKHVSSMHDKNGCHAITYEYEKKIIGYETYDAPIIEKRRIDRTAEECRCRRYVGPNSSWVPELEGGS